MTYYFVRWYCGQDEVDTPFTCRYAAYRFAARKGGTIYTLEEYNLIMSEEIAANEQ